MYPNSVPASVMESSSIKYPEGRVIPSMHTGDLQNARPRQNTKDRNIWQDQYVSRQIESEPQKIQRQIELHKAYRNPLFHDYHYQAREISLSQQASPSDFYARQGQHTFAQPPPPQLAMPQQGLQQPQQQVPSGANQAPRLNDSIDKLLLESRSDANLTRNANASNALYSARGIGQHGASPYVMRVTPGTSAFKAPYSNIQVPQNDESKSILRRADLQPVFDIRDKMYATTEVQDASKYARPASNRSSKQQVQNIVNAQRVAQVGRDGVVAGEENRQTQVLANQSNLQDQSAQARGNGARAPPPPPAQQQFDKQVQRNQSMAELLYAQNANNGETFEQMTRSQAMKKQYSIQNVVTHKDYMRYLPKYDLPQNRYDKYDREQYQNFNLKGKAPVDIKRQKNANIFSSQEYGTTAKDLFQRYDYMQQVK